MSMKMPVWLMCLPFALSAQIPESVLPAGVGVNIHFVKGHERDLDMIAAAGFKFVRMDFTWAGIERRKGEYDWSGYDELTANLEKRGLRALYILDYSNSLYEEEVTSKNPITGQQHKTIASPQRPESVAAFAQWARMAAKRFRGRNIIWEIWNEPNIHFWQPEPDVQQYTTLALATIKAIRAADPEATIVAPATSEFPWAFLEDFLKSGVLEHLDAVSVHPYRNYTRSPETVAPDYAKLQVLMDRYAPAPKQGKIPILSGEWGYATHTKGLSLETQAQFAVRQQLVNLLHNVPLSIWYDLKNDGNDPNEREHNFGTVMPDLTPKPAYTAIQTLTRELAGYRIVRRVPTGSEMDFAILLADSQARQKVAVWTTGEPREVKVAFARDGMVRDVDVLPAVNGDGQPGAATVRAGELVLALTPWPQYIALPPKARLME